MKIFSIYKATNKTNGKVYIGVTNNLDTRKKTHRKSSFNKTANDYNVIFHKAIRRYGWNNFQWEIICQHKDGKFIKNIMEPYFIDVYNSFYKFGYGYNMTLGGDGILGHIASEETKQKRSLAKIGKKHTEEHKKNLSKALKGMPKSKEHKQIMSVTRKGKPSPHKGRIHTKIAKENMSNGRTGVVSSYKNWLLIDPEGNHHEVANLAKFCRDNPSYGLNHLSIITYLSRGKKSYKNWKYNIISS